MATMTIDYGEGKYHVWAPITGTSANDYPATAQAEWAKAYVYNAHKTIYIENTGGSNSITVKVSVKPSPNDAFEGVLKDNAGVAEPTVAAGAFALYNIAEPTGQINVYIKSTVGGSHSTFKVIASGYMQ